MLLLQLHTVHQKTNFRHPPITSHSVVKEEESPCSPSSSCTRTVNTEPTRSVWSGKGHLQTWTLVIWFGPVRWWWQWLWMGLPMCTQDEAAVYLAGIVFLLLIIPSWVHNYITLLFDIRVKPLLGWPRHAYLVLVHWHCPIDANWDGNFVNVICLNQRRHISYFKSKWPISVL